MTNTLAFIQRNKKNAIKSSALALEKCQGAVGRAEGMFILDLHAHWPSLFMTHPSCQVQAWFQADPCPVFTTVLH